MAVRHRVIRIRAKNRAISQRLMRGPICGTRGVSHTHFPKNTLGREPHARFRVKGDDVVVNEATDIEVGDFMFRQEQMRRMRPSLRDLVEHLTEALT